MDVEDKRFGGTPLGWALYGWCDPPPEAERGGYYEAVARLIAAGATIDEDWLAAPERERSIAQKVRGDQRMRLALKGEPQMTARKARA